MRRLAPLVLALPVVLLLTSCGPAGGTDGGGPSTGAGGSQARLADFRAQVRTVSEQVGIVLADAVGSRLEFVSGRYAVCTDDTEAFAYDANGRLDLASGSAAGDAVRPLTAALEKDGWKVEQRDDGGGDVRLVASKDDLVMTVRINAATPIVLYTVASPCLEVPEDQRAELVAERDEIIVAKRP